jgi:hypothetical protein
MIATIFLEFRELDICVTFYRCVRYLKKIIRWRAMCAHARALGIRLRQVAIISLTIRTGVISNYILNVTCGNGAYRYISFVYQKQIATE